MEMVKLEISELLATCLTRMLYDEIANQNKWLREEEKEFGKNLSTIETRNKIIEECGVVREELAKQGIGKYYRY